MQDCLRKGGKVKLENRKMISDTSNFSLSHWRPELFIKVNFLEFILNYLKEEINLVLCHYIHCLRKACQVGAAHDH